MAEQKSKLRIDGSDNSNQMQRIHWISIAIKDCLCVCVAVHLTCLPWTSSQASLQFIVRREDVQCYWCSDLNWYHWLVSPIRVQFTLNIVTVVIKYCVSHSLAGQLCNNSHRLAKDTTAAALNHKYAMGYAGTKGQAVKIPDSSEHNSNSIIYLLPVCLL